MTEPVEETEPRPIRVRGSVIASRLSYVADRWGDGARRALLSKLSAADRKRAESVALDGDWFDFTLLDQIEHAIVGDLAAGDESVRRDLGRASAEYNLKRILASRKGDATSPALVIEKVGKLNLFQDFGDATCEPIDEGEVQGVALTYVYPSAIPERYCASALGFYERLVELLGHTCVSVTEPECQARGAAGHRYEVRWKVAEPESEESIDVEETEEPVTTGALSVAQIDGTTAYREFAQTSRDPYDDEGEGWRARFPGRKLLLAGAVVAGLGYGIYELVTYFTAPVEAPPRQAQVHSYACTGNIVRALRYGVPELRFESTGELEALRVTVHQSGKAYSLDVGHLAAEYPMALDLVQFAAEDGSHPNPNDSPAYLTIQSSVNGKASSCECRLQ